ncbi:MAG: hypothetical protein M3Y08_13070 [Fibrobacterota bacterium]|nr:hypothetical protein [Fibrobacterota bacterium]
MMMVETAATDYGPVLPASLPETLIIGDAFELDKGAPAYREDHRLRFETGRLAAMRTVYRNPAGEILAERNLDFTASSTRPGYSLKDNRDGYEEGASIQAGKVLVHSRASKDAVRKEKRLNVPAPYVIDGGFHPFLKENWDALTKGKRVSFHFVVPSRLDYYRFVAYEDPSRAPAGGKQKVFVAVPESRMLRMVVEPIVARYDISSRRMLEYRGLSNIDGADGKIQKVRLTYREPGL